MSECKKCAHEHEPDEPCYEADLRLSDFVMTVEQPPVINERKPSTPMFGNLAQPVAHRTQGGKGVVGRLMIAAVCCFAILLLSLPTGSAQSTPDTTPRPTLKPTETPAPGLTYFPVVMRDE